MHFEKNQLSRDLISLLLSLTAERALQRADEIDERIKKGENLGVLAGVPFVVKDNYLAFGAPTTAAAKMLENFQAPVQATVVLKGSSSTPATTSSSALDTVSFISFVAIWA